MKKKISLVKQNKTTLRFLAMFLAAIVLVTSTIGYIDTDVVYASSIQDLENKIQKLEEQNKELNTNMSDLSGKINDENQKQSSLVQKIKNTEQQISLYKQKITLMENDINTKNSEIKTKGADINKNEDLFAQRVRAMYISGSSTALATILSADSFSEFLTRAEILKRISKSDKELIEELTNQKNDLVKIKTEMQQQNKKLNETKTKFTATSNSLASMKTQSESNEAELKRIWTKYYADKKANEKVIKAQQAEIDRIIAENAGNGAAPEGAFKWPVPVSSRITSPYGFRNIFGYSEFHRGIDIGAASGSSIVAAHAGKVIAVKKQSYGYGWHIIVDHGGGYVTLYAHCSRIDVAVGDIVTRGQTIGGVGTTGNSTGNHLHFEVRVNGAYKNPIGYVKRPN